MKKLLFYLLIATSFIGCKGEPKNTSQTNIQVQGEWGVDGIDPKTGTIFNENGDTKFLKLSDLDKKFNNTETSTFIKVVSDDKEKSTSWLSRFTIKYVTEKFRELSQIIDKDPKKTDIKEVKKFDDELNGKIIMDMIVEEKENKVHTGLSFTFFSDKIYTKAEDLKIKIGGKEYYPKKISLQASEPFLETNNMTKSCVSMIVIPITDDIIEALYRLKNNEEITITLKLDGVETSYKFKYIMDNENGIYPLLMKVRELNSKK